MSPSLFLLKVTARAEKAWILAHFQAQTTEAFSMPLRKFPASVEEMSTFAYALNRAILIYNFYPCAVCSEDPENFFHVTVQDGRFHGGYHL